MTTDEERRADEAAGPEPTAALIAGREWPAALGVGAVASAIAGWLLRLWVVPLSVPLGYLGDANAHLMIIQGLGEGQWYFRNPRLGAPFGQEMFDYPTGDHLQLLGYKALMIVTGGNAGLAMNLGILLGFFVIAAVAYKVLRKFGIDRPWAASLGVLYSLLPYRMVRIMGHQFLSMYVAVPLAVLLIVGQVRGNPAFVSPPDEQGRRRFRVSLRDPQTRLTLLLAIVIGTTGIYYAVFAGLFLLVCAAIALAGDRDFLRFTSTVAVAAAIGIFLGAGLAPSVLYQAANGVNDQAVNRSYGDVERYALKPIQLLLPIPNHRIEALTKPMQRAQTGTTASEGGQSLGAIGAIGLAALVLAGLASLIGRGAIKDENVRLMSGLAIGSILAASVAGFGALFGLIGFTQIRAWNRISVYVAFFVFVALGSWLSRRTQDARRSRIPVWGLVMVIVLIGALDQSGPVSDEVADQRAVSWESDAAFVGLIEQTLGDDALVFQVPYMPFPEAPAPVGMSDYDLLKGYFHSDTLRWSYGAMRGRVPEWQVPLVSGATSEMVIGIVAAGFEGLYVDRYGFADGAAALEADVKEYTGVGAVSSMDGRLAFFDLRDTARALQTTLTSAELEALRSAVLLEGISFDIEYGEGFSLPETDGTASWRWAGPTAELSLRNEGASPVSVSLSMELLTGSVTGEVVRIEGPFGTAETTATNTAGSFEATFDLPVGLTTLRLSTDAAPVDAPGDPRDLRFQVRNLQFDFYVWDDLAGWRP